MKKLVTHNGKFHTDDVLAAAILSKYFGMKGEWFEFVRSRDLDMIASADVVFDVGDSYDPSLGRFDHHQKGRAGLRTSGIPYAACGLVWKHFGPELCSGVDVWNSIDKSLVEAIDAGDNGISTETELFSGVKSFSLGNVVDCFLPENEDADLLDFDVAFQKAVSFVEFVLGSVIKKYERVVQNKKDIAAVYEASLDKKIVLCEKYIPGAKKLLSDFPESVYVIYPDQNGKWRLEGVRVDKDDFPIRKNLPESWAGLRDEEFQKVSEVQDATFCHPGLFTAGALSREGALALAKKALLM